MGVYIPNMDMPKAGRIEATIQVRKDGTAIIALSPSDDGIGNWREYHLIPVPPHGRLIDADAILNTDRQIYRGDTAIGARWCITLDEVEEAPTIIPAEK